jgi:hypothetical protein
MQSPICHGSYPLAGNGKKNRPLYWQVTLCAFKRPKVGEDRAEAGVDGDDEKVLVVEDDVETRLRGWMELMEPEEPGGDWAGPEAACLSWSAK